MFRSDHIGTFTPKIGVFWVILGLLLFWAIAAPPAMAGNEFALFDGGGFPTPTPTTPPTLTPEPTASPTPISLEAIFPTETPTPVFPYPPEVFLEDAEGAQAKGFEPIEDQAQSPSLLLLSLPFAAAALILAVIVLNWVRRSRE